MPLKWSRLFRAAPRLFRPATRLFRAAPRLFRPAPRLFRPAPRLFRAGTWVTVQPPIPRAARAKPDMTPWSEGSEGLAQADMLEAIQETKVATKVVIKAVIKVVTKVADKVRTAVRGSIFEGAKESQPSGKVTISIGMAGWPMHGKTAASLIEAADTALYDAKRAGRDQVKMAGGTRS